MVGLGGATCETLRDIIPLVGIPLKKLRWTISMIRWRVPDHSRIRCDVFLRLIQFF